MAYVPDKAIDHEEDVSPAAGRLYRYYCKWRDHETRQSRRGFERAAQDLNMSRANAYRAQAQLVAEKWITVGDDGRVTPVMGTFKPFDKLCDDHWREWQGRDFRGAKPPCLKNETGRCPGHKNNSPSLNFETKNLISETENLKNETGSPNDRARASITSSITSPSSHTPGLESQDARARGDGGAGGVCVKSKFSQAERERYAKGQGTKLHNPAGWLAASADGRFDELIEREIKRADAAWRPKAAERKCDASCPDCFGTGKQFVQGKGVKGSCPRSQVLAAGNSDPPGSVEDAA